MLLRGKGNLVPFCCKGDLGLGDSNLFFEFIGDLLKF